MKRAKKYPRIHRVNGGRIQKHTSQLYHKRGKRNMLRNYDAWLTADRHAEAGEQVIAYDFEGNPVTEGELPYYYSVEGKLVPKDDEQALKDFLDMDLSDYQDFLKTHYLVTEPTPQDFQ